MALIEDPNVQAMIRGWQKRGRAEGRAEGARAMLYKVLAARSFRVTPKVRARIDSESDLARLESWAAAAVNADVIADVFRR